MADLSKKRKFLFVKLDLPEEKRKCLESECHCDAMSVQEELVASGSDSMHSPHLAQVESAKDSNSFLGEADTAASGFAEVGFGHGHAAVKDRDACDYLQEMADMCDAEKGPISEISGRRFNSLFSSSGDNPHEYGLQMRQMLEEKLLEFGVDLTLGCPEYANECRGKLSNNEAERSNYMLSGKSWVTEEPLSVPKKPTIDQEFEDYFVDVRKANSLGFVCIIGRVHPLPRSVAFCIMTFRMPNQLAASCSTEMKRALRQQRSFLIRVPGS